METMKTRIALCVFCTLLAAFPGRPVAGESPTGIPTETYAFTIERAAASAKEGVALAVDSNGASRISFPGSATIKMAEQLNGAWWAADSLAPNKLSSVTALVLDAQGADHIAYVTSNFLQQYLYYVTDQGGAGWQQPVLLDSPSPSPASVAIAVDAANHPHITYCTLEANSSKTQLRYAYFDGADWQNQQINSEVCWLATALAFDSQGVLHIAFYSPTGTDRGKVRAGVLTKGTWQLGDVDAPGDAGAKLSLAMGTDDTPHILYSRGVAGHNGLQTIYYAHQVAGVWRTEQAGSARTLRLTGGLALALDSSNHPYYAYLNSSPVSLVFAWRTDADWQYSSIATKVYGLGRRSLQIDSTGAPRIAYVKNAALEYATGRHVLLDSHEFLPSVAR